LQMIPMWSHMNCKAIYKKMSRYVMIVLIPFPSFLCFPLYYIFFLSIFILLFCFFQSCNVISLAIAQALGGLSAMMMSEPSPICYIWIFFLIVVAIFLKILWSIFAVLYTPPPSPSGLCSDTQTPRTVLGLSKLSERTPRTASGFWADVVQAR
jgi:hypothetical protein